MGKSKTVKLRHSNPKQEITNQRGQNGCEYGNFSVIPIEQVKFKTMDFLAEREGFCQIQLRV